jgi:hypothetical protein
MPRFQPVLSSIFCVAALASMTGACGTDASGTDACRRIEQARCRKAVVCPKLGLSTDNVELCVQFARNHCLHGLAVGDPGPATVDPCVKAIEEATTCDVIAAPETAPACSFLKPSPPSEDAGADTSESDAGTSSDADGTGEGG